MICDGETRAPVPVLSESSARPNGVDTTRVSFRLFPAASVVVVVEGKVKSRRGIPNVEAFVTWQNRIGTGSLVYGCWIAWLHAWFRQLSQRHRSSVNYRGPQLVWDKLSFMHAWKLYPYLARGQQAFMYLENDDPDQP